MQMNFKSFSNWISWPIFFFSRNPRSSRRAILLKYLFFFSRSDFFKEISRGLDVIRKHMNFVGEDIILLKEHIKLSRRTKISTRTNINFLGEARCTRTHQNSQESFLKILQEHIQFSRRKKYHQNRFSRRSCPKFR